MKKVTLLVLISSLSISALHAQVNFSDAFQKTIKKIAKERVKAEVIDWITEQDPISGIVARDLIGQVIDSKDEKVLLQSTSNVVLTMLFLGGVRNRVEAILDSVKEVEEQARSVPWNRNQLVAYTSLYFYYSERIKYGLPVAAEILKMSNEKNVVESFRTKQGRKWSGLVSQRLIRERRLQRDFSLDVRTLEFVQKSVYLLLFRNETYKAEVDSAFESLIRAYPLDRAFANLLTDLRGGRAAEDVLMSLFEEYLEAFQVSYKSDNIFLTTGYGFELTKVLKDEVIEIEGTVEKARERISNVFASTFHSLIQTARHRFVQQEQFSVIIMSILRDLIEHWMTQARQSDWRIDYVFSLAGTGILNPNGNTVDFTVLDQIRLTSYGESTKIFLFIGGFFDPIIKSTLYTDGAKYYLVGGGGGYKSAYISVAVGFPYPAVDLDKARVAVTVGYEIAIEDVVE